MALDGMKDILLIYMCHFTMGLKHCYKTAVFKKTFIHHTCWWIMLDDQVGLVNGSERVNRIELILSNNELNFTDVQPIYTD